MYKFLGYLNIALIVVITAPYWLRKLNEWFFHTKKPGFQKLLKGLRRLHKPLALLLLVDVALHGYLALGGFRWHTGTVAALGFLLTALFGLLFYLRKKPALLKWHKALALLSVLLVAIHLLWPNAIGVLFG